jgi:hypothetical protein
MVDDETCVLPPRWMTNERTTLCLAETGDTHHIITRPSFSALLANDTPNTHSVTASLLYRSF